MKRAITLLSGAIAVLFAFPVQSSAQLVTESSQPMKAIPAEMQQKQKELRARYPGFFAVKGKSQSKSHDIKPAPVGPQAPITASRKGGKTVLTINGQTQLVVNMTSRNTFISDDPYSELGLFYMQAANPENMSPMFTADLFEGAINNPLEPFTYLGISGAAYQNNTLWGGYISYGSFYQASLNLSTGAWQRTYKGSDFSMLPVETANVTLGADYGMVYGEFLSNDGNDYEFGIADFANGTRTTFGTTDKVYVAMGVTSDGKLYGVATDGVLYQIDTTTGAETEIGETGVKVVADDGIRYYQTGEIDQKDNTFYWICPDPDRDADDEFQATLYTVDLTTGKATAKYVFTDGEYITNMYVAPRPADDDAPGHAENVSVSLDNNNNRIKVSFTAPAKSFAEKDLTGDLYYWVGTSGTSAQGKTVPGGETSCYVDAAEGQNIVTVVIYNQAEDGSIDTSRPSEPVRGFIWVGNDQPVAPANAEMSYNKTTQKVRVTWEAPTRTVHGGYLGTLTYSVIRYKGGVGETVATNLDKTEFAESIAASDDLISYYYGIVAVNGTQFSAEAQTNGQIIGKAQAVPYTPDFSTIDAYRTFTVIDANEDGERWGYNSYYKVVGLSFNWDKVTPADDWLISPAVKLEKGKTYRFSMNVRGYNANCMERVEVYMGQGTTVEAMTKELVAPFEFRTGEWTPLQSVFTVDADGEYNFGIHGISDADGNIWYVDKISVVYLDPANLGETTDLKVEVGAQGALTAKVSFKAPEKNLEGKALKNDEIAKVEILRDGEVIETKTGVKPGTMVTYNDAVTASGSYTYSVIAYRGTTPNDEVSAKVYIGTDIPQAPQNFSVVDNEESLLISWDKASEVGANGGYVDPAGVTYKRASGWSYVDVADNHEFIQLTEAQRTGKQSDQSFTYYAMNENVSSVYSAKSASADYVVGAPYELPVFYDFNYFTDDQRVYYAYDGNYVSSFHAVGRQDVSEAGGWAIWKSGKISLKGTNHPAMSLSLANTSKDNVTKVIVHMADGKTETLADEIVPGSNTYNTNVVDLSRFASQRYIRIELRTDFAEPGSVYFGDLYVYESAETDLAVVMTAPEEVEAGREATVRLKLNNYGKTTAESYVVKLMEGDKELANETIDEYPIAEGEAITLVVGYVPDATTKGETTLKAIVELEGDQVEENNESEAVIDVLTPSAPAPQTVAAAEAEDGSVNVIWTAPATESYPMTEDFEDYDLWSIDNIGEWTLVNNNEAMAGPILANGMPNDLQPYAFMVASLFDYLLLSEYKAHSGNNYLYAPYRIQLLNGNYYYAPCDNWLISPQLSGKEQTISFWMACKTGGESAQENIKVYYSKDGKNIEDFVKIGHRKSTTSTSWAEFFFDVPEGAKYFALQQKNYEGENFALLLDDITYIKGGEIVGYKVYVDGELVATTDAETLTCTLDALKAGDYKVAVTAVYADGKESTATFADLTTAIQGVKNAEPFDVYSLDGKLVRRQTTSVSGLKGIYVIGNQKVVLK